VFLSFVFVIILVVVLGDLILNVFIVVVIGFLLYFVCFICVEVFGVI